VAETKLRTNRTDKAVKEHEKYAELDNAYRAEESAIMDAWKLHYGCDKQPSVFCCVVDLALAFRWLVDTRGIDTGMGIAPNSKRGRKM
jgi:hypothetical protein